MRGAPDPAIRELTKPVAAAYDLNLRAAVQIRTARLVCGAVSFVNESPSRRPTDRLDDIAPVGREALASVRARPRTPNADLYHGADRPARSWRVSGALHVP